VFNRFAQLSIFAVSACLLLSCQTFVFLSFVSYAHDAKLGTSVIPVFVLLVVVLAALRALPSLLVAMKGPAQLLVEFKRFGRYFDVWPRPSDYSLAILGSCAALAIGHLSGIGVASTLHGLLLRGSPKLAFALSLVPSRLMVLLVWGLACQILALVLVGRGLVGHRRTHGEARFQDLQKMFTSRRNAVAALLVKRPQGRRARTALVKPAGDWSTRLAYLNWDFLSRHMLIVGNTGSGKTTGIFNHLMLSSEIPWIYQDQKADLPLQERFRDRPVWGLDTRGYVTRSLVWNPMDEVHAAGDAEVMAALLFPDKGDQNDWVIRSARLIFESLIKGEPFESIQALSAVLENDSPQQLMDRLPAGWGTAMADIRQRGYFVQALLEVLRPWSSCRVSEVTAGRSTVTLDDFVERGGYVLCNEDRSLRAPVTLFWGMLLHRLRNRPSHASPLLLLLDELGDAARIPNIAEALAMYRSKNVAIVAGIQTDALMKLTYEREWEAIRDGFGALFVMAAHLPRNMCERLSRDLGQLDRRMPSLSLGRAGLTVGTGQPLGSNLVTIDEWGAWGEARACLARANHSTWWVPHSVALRPAPLGMPQPIIGDGWRDLERERLAAFRRPSPADPGGESWRVFR